MASTKSPIPRYVQGGFDRSGPRHNVPAGSFWDLLNLKPSSGQLVQTPWLLQAFALTTLAGETPGTQVRMLDLVRNANGDYRYLVLNQQNARFVDPVVTATQVLIPVVKQIAVPNRTTAASQCLLWGISTLDFGTADDQFDVQILNSGTQFQWRKNSGAWQGPLAIGPEVNIATGLKVGFVETTPANMFDGDTWSWKRLNTHGYTGADSTTFNFRWNSDVLNTDIYIAGLERQIFRIRDDVMTTVGYKKAYGKYVSVFQNHLVIGQFAEGAYDAVNGVKDTFNAKTTPFTLGWSHRENPDLLFATSVNEADQYNIPEQGQFDQAPLGITGMGQWSGRLIIYLADSCHYMTYVGLPIVMKVEQLNPSIGNQFQAGLVVTPNGHFFIGRENIWRFDGQFTRIGSPVIDKFFSEVAPLGDPNRQKLYGDYNADTGEVTWTYWIKVSTGVYQIRQMCYSLTDNTWYFRNLPSDSTDSSDIFDVGPKYLVRGVRLYAGAGEVYTDQTSETSGFIEDYVSSGGVGFTEPMCESGFFNYGDWFHIKESDTIFVDAGYEDGAGVEVAVCVTQQIGQGNQSFVNVPERWIPQLAEGRLSLPRVSGRQFAYRFSFKKGGSPVRNAVLNGWQEHIYGAKAEK